MEVSVSGVSLNTNVASMRAQTQLARISQRLSTVFERLASGQRINHASDDAAGLAVSSTLKTDTRVYSQGIRNLNDGLSLLNISDGALGQLSNLVIRIRELSTQAANGSFSLAQRRVLDNEANTLVNEYNRIVASTKFNSLGLLNRSLTSLRIQSGYGTSGSISFGITNELRRVAGDGTFQDNISISIPETNPADVVSADLNGDGNLDIATADYGDDKIYVRMGNGDGSFQAEVAYTTANQANGIIAKDLNGDGRLDLAVANFNGGAAGSVSVLINTGAGAFGAATNYSTAGNSATSVVSADFNGDGFSDLGVTNYNSGSLAILLANPNGTFQAATTYAVGSRPQHVISGDFNGDGKTDLAVANQGSYSIGILLGTGQGSFSAMRTVPTGGGADPQSIVAVDFNGDGCLDLASANFGVNYLTLAFGNGDGSFAAIRTIDLGSSMSSIVSTDFNGDGIPDLAISGASSAFLLGNGDGSFSISTVMTLSSSQGLTFGDYNGDGALDLLATDDGSIVTALANPQSFTTLGRVNLTTVDNARISMSMMDQTLQRISLERGAQGAAQSRIAASLGAIAGGREAMQSAYGRIADADIAEESVSLVRIGILREAASAVLAQANLQPKIALNLLSNL